MAKKLFALLAAAFMVASLFVGVAFAAPAEVKVTLNTDTLIVGEDNYAITGTIKKLSGKLITEPTDVELVGALHEVSTVAINGAFTLEFSKDDVEPNTQYIVEADLSAEYAVPDEWPRIDYRYNIVFDSVPVLKFHDDNQVLTGKVVNSKGVGVPNVLVQFIDSDTTRSNGMFVLNIADVNRTGDQYVNVDRCETYKLSIAALPFAEFSAAESLIHSAYAVNPDFALVTTGDTSVVESANTSFVFSGVKIRATNNLKNNDIEGPGCSELTTDGAYYTQLAINGQALAAVLSDGADGGLTFAEKGAVHVVANYMNGQYVSSLDIEIVDPQALNLDVDLLDELANPLDATVAMGYGYLEISAFDAQGTSVDVYDWEISGTGFEASITEGDQEVTPVELIFVSGGKLTLTVTGYDDDGEEIGIATYDMDIDGWTYTINPGEFTVNQKTGVTVMIKNLDGEPVNNAYVWISNGYNDYWCDASEENIVNGTYTVKDVVFDRTDREVLLEVETLDGTSADMIYDYFPVNPEVVYTLEMPNNKITAGVATDFAVKVLQDGEAVVGLEGCFDIVSGGESIASFGEVTYDPETETYTIPNIVVSTDADTDIKDVNLQVLTDVDETNQGVYVGRQPLEVFLPVVTINPAPLTYMYQEDVTVTITDPQTGNPIKATVTFTGSDIGAVVEMDGQLIFSELLADEDFVLPVRVKRLVPGPETVASQYQFKAVLIPFPNSEGPIDEDTLKLSPELTVHTVAIEDGGEVYLGQTVSAGTAVLSLDKSTFYMGYANPTTITLKNARGEALAGYTICRGSGEISYIGDKDDVVFWNTVENQEPIGVLDDNGALLYSFTPANTGKVYFTAEDDFEAWGSVVLAQANSTQDLNGPAINVALPATTTDSSIMLTGTVTDDTRVANVYVNNARVAIIPGTSTTFVYELPLVDGANVVSIIALDANGNGASYMGTISKVAPTPKSVSVTIGKVDANAGLDVPAYAENGRTMVPLAFVAKTLGGTAEWDAVTDTVKIVLGGKTVVVTIGSSYATVNGAPTTLLAPVTARNGRTFVALADLANLLGATTSWDGATQTATVVMP